MSYKPVVKELSRIREYYALDGTSVGELISAAESAAVRLDSGEPDVPDLRTFPHDKLRYLKRRVKQAKKEGRTEYRGVPISTWAVIIQEREEALGVGTKGGRPPEPI